MFFRHHVDKLIYPVIVFVIVVVVCYRPTYHLRTDMPAAFFSPAKEGQVSSRQQKIAWAYWESAQMDLQWKYPHGHPLPVDPPPEFRIDALALGPAASDPVVRLFYWHRLREIWYSPEIWKTDYEWNFTWASDPLSSAGQWLKEQSDKYLSIR